MSSSLNKASAEAQHNLVLVHELVEILLGRLGHLNKSGPVHQTLLGVCWDTFTACLLTCLIPADSRPCMFAARILNWVLSCHAVLS